MRKSIPLFSLLILFFFSSSAQLTYRSHSLTIQKEESYTLSEMPDDWMPFIKNLEMPFPGGNPDKEKLKELKEQMKSFYESKKHQPVKKTRSGASDLILIRDFKGNNSSGAPNDNDMAISNDGKLISVVNTNTWIYDTKKDTVLKSTGFNGFDPKIYYDPVDDKFIMVYLTGSKAPNTIHVDFSATNNPLGVWNKYTIVGSPFNDTTWSDYPIIGATKKEFFITLNMVKSGLTWQAGFRGSIIYQMDKQSAYSGTSSLNIYRHDSISFNNTLVRNLCPVRGGSTTYGPNMYFLSNKNLTPQSDTLFLLEITDTIGAPLQELKINVLKTPVSYFLPPNGKQKGGNTLATNDSRVLGAFYENNKIQFVQNTGDTSNGFAAALHGVISNVTTAPTVTTTVIGDSIHDFGYPNISYAGNSNSDNSSIITFNHAGATIYPGISAVKYDEYGNYSDVLYIKDGTSFTGPATQGRWGDYSGSQRRYNEPGVVWMSGYNGIADFFNSGTWIASLGLDVNASVGKKKQENYSSKVFPNPASDFFSLTFNLPEDQKMSFTINDIKGILIKELMQSECYRGKNLFQFSTSYLSSGIYFLKIHGEKKFILSEKIVKQ